jgi:hypothetical protein
MQHTKHQNSHRRVSYVSLFSILLTALLSITVEAAELVVGNEAERQYAAKLWSVLVREQIEGEDRISSALFFGGAKPHGEILELKYQNITVGDYTGFVVVKRNYGKAGEQGVRGVVTAESVSMDRAKYLGAITVMFQRESGYDEENQNWFWVKYHPDGSLFDKEIGGQNRALAGKIAGCIYCHSAAGGGEYIFYREIILPQ